MNRKYWGKKAQLLTNKWAVLFSALWTQAPSHTGKVIYWANVINWVSVCGFGGLFFPCFPFWEILLKAGIWCTHCQQSRWIVNIWNCLVVCFVFFSFPNSFERTEALLWAFLFILEVRFLFLKAVLDRLEESKIEESVAYWFLQEPLQVQIYCWHSSMTVHCFLN